MTSTERRRMAVAALCMGVLAGGTFGAQLPAYATTYQRAQVEAFPESEKRPILEWLDASRAVADRAVDDLASGRIDACFDEIAETAAVLNTGFDRRELRRDIRRACGSIVGSEYLGEQVSFNHGSRNDSSRDLAHAQSRVFYVLRTTKQTSEPVYLAVDVIEREGRHRVVYVWIQTAIPSATDGTQ